LVTSYIYSSSTDLCALCDVVFQVAAMFLRIFSLPEVIFGVLTRSFFTYATDAVIL